MTLAEQLLGCRLSPGLLPETQDALRDWSRRQMCRLEATGNQIEVLPPSFPFQHLPDSQRLSYELVDWHNYPAYLPLFATDPSAFVEARFRQRELLETYAVDLLTDMRFSWKRGGCDWLLRRRTDNQPVGVLHLYELSHEIIGEFVPHCCVGYAVAAPFRRQGIGREALSHLLVQAARLFNRTEARALTCADNTASQGLLQASGFTLLEERLASHSRGAGQLWHRLLR